MMGTSKNRGRSKTSVCHVLAKATQVWIVFDGLYDILMHVCSLDCVFSIYLHFVKADGLPNSSDGVIHVLI